MHKASEYFNEDLSTIVDDALNFRLGWMLEEIDKEIKKLNKKGVPIPDFFKYPDKITYQKNDKQGAKEWFDGYWNQYGSSNPKETIEWIEDFIDRGIKEESK